MNANVKSVFIFLKEWYRGGLESNFYVILIQFDLIYFFWEKSEQSHIVTKYHVMLTIMWIKWIRWFQCQCLCCVCECIVDQSRSGNKYKTQNVRASCKVHTQLSQKWRSHSHILSILLSYSFIPITLSLSFFLLSLSLSASPPSCLPMIPVL